MKNISTLFIIVGVIIGVIPIVGQFNNSYRQRLLTKEFRYELQEVFEENTEGNVEEIQQVRIADNILKEQDSTISVSISSEEKLDSQKLLGILKIDKINVDVPIVQGTKEENLKIGVGHLIGTSDLGQVGNCALAGHRSYTFGKFFNRLNELEIEDKIVIITKDTNYTYAVYKKYIVEPTDISVLEGNKNEKILTLITCEPIYTATHRLIIHAKVEE